jgi:hypothetical protein
MRTIIYLQGRAALEENEHWGPTSFSGKSPSEEEEKRKIRNSLRLRIIILVAGRRHPRKILDTLALQERPVAVMMEGNNVKAESISYIYLHA